MAIVHVYMYSEIESLYYIKPFYGTKIKVLSLSYLCNLFHISIKYFTYQASHVE
jgi:hypothetical protein